LDGRRWRGAFCPLLFGKGEKMSYELTEQPKLPCPLIDNPEWKYIPAASTNIAETFKRFGFVPPSTLKESK